MKIEKVTSKTPSFDISEVHSFVSMQTWLLNKYNYYVEVEPKVRREKKIKPHDIQEYMNCEFGYNEYQDVCYYFFMTELDGKRFMELLK